MKNYKLFAILLILPFIVKAQNCISPFGVETWFNQIRAVRISPDGSKFLALSGTGPVLNSNIAFPGQSPTSTSVKIYDITPSGIVYNNAQSINLGGVFAVSYFTQNNGFFHSVNTSGSSYSLNFRSSTGTATNLGTYSFDQPKFNKVLGAPNKSIVRFTTDTRKYVILDASNPALPTASAAADLPGTVSGMNLNLGGGNNSSLGIIAATQIDDRIYYSTTETEAAATVTPHFRYKIKAVTMTGAVVPGWTDVIIQRGAVNNIQIRPSDGMVFVRTIQSGDHLGFHGVVAFDKFGNLASGLNMTDLSLMGGPAGSNSNDDYDLHFDSEGNIYANIWCHVQGPNANTIGYGLMKFDPNGNLDLGFLRNGWDSYSYAASVGAFSFDISDTGIIIKCGAGGNEAYFGSYALSPTHVNANNEDPTGQYSSAAGGWIPVSPSSAGTSYRSLQFVFNNGRLVLPNMTQTSINGYCGIADPEVVPPAPSPAVGMIDCAKTAFISAPVQGTPASIAIRVTINVTTVGTFFPITLTGSGFSLADPSFTISPTTTGVQNFIIPAKYDGSALSTVDIGVGQAGTCTADLSGLPNDTKKVEIEIWTPENCTFKQSGPSLK